MKPNPQTLSSRSNRDSPLMPYCSLSSSSLSADASPSSSLRSSLTSSQRHAVDLTTSFPQFKREIARIRCTASLKSAAAAAASSSAAAASSSAASACPSGRQHSEGRWQEWAEKVKGKRLLSPQQIEQDGELDGDSPSEEAEEEGKDEPRSCDENRMDQLTDQQQDQEKDEEQVNRQVKQWVRHSQGKPPRPSHNRSASAHSTLSRRHPDLPPHLERMQDQERNQKQVDQQVKHQVKQQVKHSQGKPPRPGHNRSASAHSTLSRRYPGLPPHPNLLSSYPLRRLSRFFRRIFRCFARCRLRSQPQQVRSTLLLPHPKC
ncbi:unnamed protein product [Closterium sp. Yama58-4]|nr:unnamed protein product [Closterium sp. Yama58-4]